jgi:hypothetical protein
MNCRLSNPAHSKHTPGPWEVSPFTRKGEPTRIDAEVEGETVTIAVLGKRGDETAANAELIAAAPELLQACRDTLTHMEVEV